MFEKEELKQNTKISKLFQVTPNILPPHQIRLLESID